MIRRSIAAALAAACLASAAASAAPATPATGQATPTTAGGCSESGDTCQALLLRAGGLVVRVVLAEHYVNSYKVCATMPSRVKVCRVRTVRYSGRVWVAQFSVARPAPGVWRMDFARLTVPRRS